MTIVAQLTIYPLTPERWSDLERLFGPRGAYSGCWCMWWRISRAEFDAQRGQGNRQALRALVESADVPPGILGYAGDRAVGWCSVAPRAQYASLNRSRILKPVDDAPVWSLVCLFVDTGWRHQGVALAMVRGAVEYVRQQGGVIVEAYPTVPKHDGQLPPVSSFMGTPSLYAQAGFAEVARPSNARMIMRYVIESP